MFDSTSTRQHRNAQDGKGEMTRTFIFQTLANGQRQTRVTNPDGSYEIHYFNDKALEAIVERYRSSDNALLEKRSSTWTFEKCNEPQNLDTF